MTACYSFGLFLNPSYGESISNCLCKGILGLLVRFGGTGNQKNGNREVSEIFCWLCIINGESETQSNRRLMYFFLWDIIVIFQMLFHCFFYQYLKKIVKFAIYNGHRSACISRVVSTLKIGIYKNYKYSIITEYEF